MSLIHLVFTPHKTINIAEANIPLPSFLGYGHVHTLLQQDDQFFELDFPWEPEHLDIKKGKGKLSNLWNSALKEATVTRHATFLGNYSSEAFIQAASFEIGKKKYEKTLNYYTQQDCKDVRYHRTGQNCVFYAAQDLNVAGISTGRITGLSAGMFWNKIKRQSAGNLFPNPMN